MRFKALLQEIVWPVFHRAEPVWDVPPFAAAPPTTLVVKLEQSAPVLFGLQTVDDAGERPVHTLYVPEK